MKVVVLGEGANLTYSWSLSVRPEGNNVEMAGTESKTRPKYLSTIPGEDQPGYGGAMKAIVGAAARRGTFRGLSPSIYTEQRYKVQAIVENAKNGEKGVSNGNRN